MSDHQEQRAGEGAGPAQESIDTKGAIPDDVAAAPPAPSAEQRAEEYLRLAQRAQADLVNYRRGVETERDELFKTARVDGAASILPILDDFERALEAIPAEARGEGWVQGILLIERNLRGVVERAGLERIEARGQPFDPWAHEAVMADETSDAPEDTVTQVIRQGYRAGGRVIRPAQVMVARRKVDAAAPPS